MVSRGKPKNKFSPPPREDLGIFDWREGIKGGLNLVHRLPMSVVAHTLVLPRQGGGELGGLSHREEYCSLNRLLLDSPSCLAEVFDVGGSHAEA